ncbi:uncharacterized protein [Primulina eburnea]|uniref:uncharacterized protein n=1 Tax=Primulina eburnea TaxID=1245227 RepID=UPI003C6BF0C3
MEMASRVMSLVLVISMGYLCSSQTYTFYVVFKYKKGSDSVLVVTKDDYETCNKDSPLQVFKDGNSEFKFHKSGPFFFISGRTQHCEKGQKLVTVVLSDSHHNASSAPSPPPTHSPPLKPPPSQSPPPSSHHVPAPTPNPTHAPPPLSTISAPPGKAPQPASPTRSPIPSPSPQHQAPTPPVTPTRSPTSHSPPPSTPKIPPFPSPAAHLAPSPSSKAESPKKGDDVENHHHPAPSPHASSPEYPRHAPAPAPSAAPCFSASFSLFVGIFSLALSLLYSSFV